MNFILAIEELVMNSIDADSTCVAIRLNANTYSVKIIDNGKGIVKDYLNTIGTANHVLQHGKTIFRIRECCSSLEIVSRHRNAQDTYRISFEASSFSKPLMEQVEFRPSSGTTVIINRFLNVSSTNCNPLLYVDQIEKLVKSLSLVHSKISFSLRDDDSQPPSVFVQTNKLCHTIATARKIFHTEKNERFFTFRQSSKHFKIKGLVGKSTSGGYHQYVFVNNRSVNEPSISAVIQSIIKSKINISDPVIILNLKCSRTEYCFNFVHNQRSVEFKHLELLVSLIQKALTRICWRLLTVPPPNIPWIPEPEMSQSANECLFLATNLDDNIVSVSPIISKILDRPNNPVVNQQSELPFSDVEMEFVDPTTLQNGASFKEPQSIETTCRYLSQTFSRAYGKISWDNETVDISQRFITDLTRNVNQQSGHCNMSVNQIIHEWETQEENCSSASLGHKSFFLELGKSFKELKTQENHSFLEVCGGTSNERHENRFIQNLVDGAPSDKIEKTTSSGSSIQISDFNGISNIACQPLRKPNHTLLTQNRVLLKPKENWAQSKRPLNVTNTSRHSLPFYRTIPSRRYTYDKSIFGEVAILKQVDRKFICCVAEQKEKRHLVLIDQHAAHERVCLEKLIQIHSTVNSNGLLCIKNSSVHPFLELEFSAEDIEKIQHLQSDLMRFGLQWRVRDVNHISITHVPACFLSREASEVHRKRSSIYKELVEMLICDTMTEFSQNGIVSACLMPTSIRNVLNSLACHGAIRFGDELSMNQSTQLVRALGQCDVPFQCAHGRPLMVPLLAIEDLLPLTSTPVKRPVYSRLNALSFS